MPGPFSKSNRPPYPGAYFNWEGVPSAPPVPPNVGGVVAVPFVHDWGPFEEPVYCSSEAEFRAVYGSGDTPGARAVRMAFKGEGLPRKGGAGTVLAYRFGGSAAAQGARTLQNTAGTPANALTLTARYEGDRGNDLRVTVEADTAAGFKRLLVLDGTTELERYVHDEDDLAALAATINANSDWVEATVVADGTSLANVSGAALTGGNDGATLVAGDWTDVMDALDVERFSLLAPYDLTDAAIRTSLVDWAKAANAAGKRFTTVLGGAAGESLATANTRSAAIADPDFVNVGVGTVRDAELALDGSEVDLSTSQLAPRIAGILAQRGEGKSITFARLAGLTILAGATATERRQAFDGGTVVLTRDSHPVAPVRIDKGLTTFTSETDADRPYEVYSRPKFVRTMHGIELELTEFVEQEDIVGVLPVSPQTRNFLVATVDERLKARVAAGAIQPEYTVAVDTDPPPSDDDEFVALVLGVAFARSTEQVYFTVRIR